jgi:hypothetical protein
LLDLSNGAVSRPISDFADAIWTGGVMFPVTLVDTELIKRFPQVPPRRQADSPSRCRLGGDGHVIA